jgi:circadian clock protein KaiC
MQMMAVKEKRRKQAHRLGKTPTGITGLDDITGGGLPKGRPALICGSAGCGKTLLAMEFLVRGAMQFNEPGVFMAFEETEEDLLQNFLSLGFDLAGLQRQKKIALDYVRIERNEIEETGEYDLEGLFVRLNYAIDSIGAKRVVLDTIEALFAGLPNQAILRAELRRLFSWLKQKGVTAIVTGERAEGTLTRYGLEEYVADCVIVLDHRVVNQISTRRMRIVKYRGSLHGTNEYPFLITSHGISVLPITSVGLEAPAPLQRLSSGVPELDHMLGGRGFFRGSSVLISGTAGTGKTSLACAFTRAACERGESCLYFAFEESRDQIIRNMSSIGMKLDPYVQKGLLHFRNIRPTSYGLEMHLVAIHDAVQEIKPRIIVIDPLTNLITVGDRVEVKMLLTRVIDLFKNQTITTIFTSLIAGNQDYADQTDIGISSLMDTWILVRDLEQNGERNRVLYLLKSRGMNHSNQVREFALSSRGIKLVDVYVGPGTVLTGTARRVQEGIERAEAVARQQEISRLRRAIKSKESATEAQITALRENLEFEIAELRKNIEEEGLRALSMDTDRQEMRLKRLPGGNGSSMAARQKQSAGRAS